MGTVAKDVEYRGVLVAEVDRLSVTEKRWVAGVFLGPEPPPGARRGAEMSL